MAAWAVRIGEASSTRKQTVSYNLLHIISTPKGPKTSRIGGCFLRKLNRYKSLFELAREGFVSTTFLGVSQPHI